MNDKEVKSVIDPETKDYALSNRKFKSIYVAIGLTILFIACAGYIFYSINKKLGTVSHIGDDIENTTVSTETSEEITNQDLTITVDDINDYLVFNITNDSSDIIDCTLYITTYIGEDISNTFTEYLVALDSSAESSIVVKKNEFGSYDSYKYEYKAINSIYKSALISGLEVTDSKENTDSFDYNIINNTGSTLTSLKVGIFYYNNDTLVDVKTKTLYSFKDSSTITINKTSLNYNSTKFKILEAYYN